MYPVLFRIGSFDITSFGVMVALGAALGILMLRRELIRSAVDLYDWRGTRRGVSEFLRLYTGYLPEIVEPGVGAKNARADQAFRFIVRIKTPEPDKVNRELVQTIIEMEKPAQAGYKLEVISGQ